LPVSLAMPCLATVSLVTQVCFHCTVFEIGD